MPDMREGSIAIDVRMLLRMPDIALAKYIDMIMSCSDCVIVDKPSIISAESGLDVVLGVGSLVCSGCGDGFVEKFGCSTCDVYILDSPAWIEGKRLNRSSRCYSNGVDEVNFLANIGVELIEIDSNTIYNIIENLRNIDKRYFVFLDKLDGLFIDIRENLCGNISTYNPLHPAGVFGKPGYRLCMCSAGMLPDRYLRLADVILSIDNYPLLLRIESLYGSLFMAASSSSCAPSNEIFKAALFLGAIYECM